VKKVQGFVVGLCQYIKSNKAKYVEIVSKEQKISPEAEEMLIAAIKEYKSTNR
jgi:F-type H+-transporting ATPase subunit alpha